MDIIQGYSHLVGPAIYANVLNPPTHHALGGGWVYPTTVCGPHFDVNWSPLHLLQTVPQRTVPQSYAAELNNNNNNTRNCQEFDYFVVIDFEATCDKLKNPHPQEIIEFPSVLVNARTGELEDCFRVYVRPTHHCKLTDFCKDLTGIQQWQVDRGVLLSEALLQHDLWLEQKGVKRTRFAVVTWSNWDCRVILESECRYKKIKKPAYFNRWINLKVTFSEAFDGAKCNLKDAVDLAGLSWEGRAHSGLDDAKNTARLLSHLLSFGLKLKITNNISWEESADGAQPGYAAALPLYSSTLYR